MQNVEYFNDKKQTRFLKTRFLKFFLFDLTFIQGDNKS